MHRAEVLALLLSEWTLRLSKELGFGGKSKVPYLAQECGYSTVVFIRSVHSIHSIRHTAFSIQLRDA